MGGTRSLDFRSFQDVRPIGDGSESPIAVSPGCHFGVLEFVRIPEMGEFSKLNPEPFSLNPFTFCNPLLISVDAGNDSMKLLASALSAKLTDCKIAVPRRV